MVRASTRNSLAARDLRIDFAFCSSSRLVTGPNSLGVFFFLAYSLSTAETFSKSVDCRSPSHEVSESDKTIRFLSCHSGSLGTRFRQKINGHGELANRVADSRIWRLSGQLM